ncbi:MAG: carbohydrate ABC transporter permease, partial [Caldilinea sp.]|nr:carbohydrate ABC transporter permease [Caldilinea sp.]
MASSETTSLTESRKAASVAVKRKTRWQPLLRSVVFNSVLLLGAFLSAFPFYWMFVLSTQSTQQIFSWPPQFMPG